MAAMNKNIVVASVALLLDEEEQNQKETKDRKASASIRSTLNLLGQGKNFLDVPLLIGDFTFKMCI